MFIHGNKEGFSDKMKVDLLISQLTCTPKITIAHVIEEDDKVFLPQEMQCPFPGQLNVA